MLRKLVLIIILAFSINTQAQEPFYKNYNWETNPIYSVENPEIEILSLKEKIASEFTFVDQQFVEYFLQHRIIYVNSDDAIERYNRVYVPLNQTSQLEIAKARVIKKNGEVLELDESKILTAKDEETGRTTKYFALEGVEKGSFVEHFYIVKRQPRYTGTRLFFQGNFDKKSVEFDLYSPSNLKFEFKSYNGIPNVRRDFATTSKFHWKLYVEDIKALKEEAESAYDAMRGAIVYKLDKNLINNQSIISYDRVAANLYSYYYPQNYSETEQKAIEKFAAKLKIKNDLSESMKIRKIDTYIKLKLSSFESGGEEMEDLTKVIENLVANETGLLKLYVALFRYFGIKHNMVLTSNRFKEKFDKDFESNNFLTDFLFYFPNTNKYISPVDKATRYGFPPPYTVDNYGLFIKEVKEDTSSYAIGNIKYIDPPTAMESNDIMRVEVSFDEEDMTNTKISLDEKSTGYNSQLPVMYLEIDFVENEEIDTYVEQLGKIVDFDDPTKKVTNHELIYDKKDELEEKFLQVKFDMTSEKFVSKAGRRYLFKIGDLIGRQLEMYQEKKRILPYEQSYKRNYDRQIKVNIPEGFKVVNLEDINIKNEHKRNGEVLFAFHSYYKLEGNVLTVFADEFYKANIVVPEDYEAYRKVINSAADFNKITLILEPQ